MALKKENKTTLVDFREAPSDNNLNWKAWGDDGPQTFEEGASVK